MRWYVIRDAVGVAVTAADPSPGRYVLGPFRSSDDAFEAAETVKRRQESRRSVLIALALFSLAFAIIATGGAFRW